MMLALFPRTPKTLDNVGQVIQRSIIGAYAPEAPPLPANGRIACLGSCFAEEISKSLAAQGKDVIPIFMSERWATPFAVKHFIEYGLHGKEPPKGYLSDHPPLARAMAESTQLANADVFIITFGISVCWFNLKTGRMVLDIKEGHAAESLEESVLTHAMRQTTVEENVTAMTDVISAIKSKNPNIPIVFTLSPIPLFASITDYPVIPSNHISKATLRVALHTVMERQIEGVYYWPSYDIVEWLAKYRGPLFGLDGEDLRHLSPSLINQITTWFSQYYFPGDGNETPTA